jgi:hypothetical protein
MPKNIHCTFEKNDTVLNTISGTRMEILKMLETRYGESYSIQISFKLFERSLVDFLMDLERKGTIMLAREGYNEKYLAMRVANAKSVSFSEFYKNLTNMDIRLLFSESWISSYLKDKNENFYMDLANK